MFSGIAYCAKVELLDIIIGVRSVLVIVESIEIFYFCAIIQGAIRKYT